MTFEQQPVPDTREGLPQFHMTIQSICDVLGAVACIFLLFIKDSV